jgi:Domain of unknown function (DUF1707)
MDNPNLHPALLAGEEDRERSVEFLTRAVVEGRLTLEESTDRVGVAQSAPTQTELTVLTLDLPATPAGALPVPYGGSAPGVLCPPDPFRAVGRVRSLIVSLCLRHDRPRFLPGAARQSERRDRFCSIRCW